MKKILLSLLFTVFVVGVFAQEDSKYLVGAVPEKDGKIFFSKVIKAKTLSKDEIYKIVSGWAGEKFRTEGGFRRKLVLSDSANLSLVALGDEYLVFQNSFLSLDRTHLLYNLTAKFADGSCEIEISRIYYLYKTASSEVPERISAEDMISDGSALRKGKLTKGTRKFRVQTIDYFNDMFEEINNLCEKRILQKLNL